MSRVPSPRGCRAQLQYTRYAQRWPFSRQSHTSSVGSPGTSCIGQEGRQRTKAIVTSLSQDGPQGRRDPRPQSAGSTHRLLSRLASQADQGSPEHPPPMTGCHPLPVPMSEGPSCTGVSCHATTSSSCCQMRGGDVCVHTCVRCRRLGGLTSRPSSAAAGVAGRAS